MLRLRTIGLVMNTCRKLMIVTCVDSTSNCNWWNRARKNRLFGDGIPIVGFICLHLNWYSYQHWHFVFIVRLCLLLLYIHDSCSFYIFIILFVPNILTAHISFNLKSFITAVDYYVRFYIHTQLTLILILLLWSSVIFISLIFTNIKHEILLIIFHS